MPGKTISERLNQSPNIESFRSFEHIVLEYFTIRTGSIGLGNAVIQRLMDKIPDRIQELNPWFHNLRHVAEELQRHLASMVHKLLEFDALNFHGNIMHWQPFDAAAWDRLFAEWVEILLPDMPQLEAFIQQIEQFAGTAPTDTDDESVRLLLNELKGVTTLNARNFRVLQHLLTEDGLEAYHAARLQGEQIDFSET